MNYPIYNPCYTKLSLTVRITLFVDSKPFLNTHLIILYVYLLQFISNFTNN